MCIAAYAEETIESRSEAKRVASVLIDYQAGFSAHQRGEPLSARCSVAFVKGWLAYQARRALAMAA